MAGCQHNRYDRAQKMANPINAWAKRALFRISPELYSVVHAAVLRVKFWTKYNSSQNTIAEMLYGRDLPRVLSGPFSDMVYLNETVWGPIAPKWLGTYERELHSIIAEAKISSYQAIVDIGSAEGYYAIGLARLAPTVPVFSYDTDPWARAQQRRLAAANQVANVHIRGRCDARELQERLKRRALLVCDIEGFELSLLDPSSIDFSQCDVLVEIHEGPGISADEAMAAMKLRFSATHQQVEIPSSIRMIEDLPEAAKSRLDSKTAVTSMDEGRIVGQSWLWMVPLRRGTIGDASDQRRTIS